jgi:hypothetical protein|tara:strand:+ start:2344 stop:2613 length:270 start_codon:yes stop_codon:yes gene_type:complete
MIIPELPQYLTVPSGKLREVYTELLSWAGQLKTVIETRDLEITRTPSTKILTVTTVTDIGRPASGDVAFSLGEGKFKGYVSGTGWVNFN